MKSSNTRTRLLASSIITGATLLLAGTAVAQTAPASTQVGEVVITGSRIAGVSNAKSASAISVVTIDQINETKSDQLEEVLARTIGPDFSGETINNNNGGDGESSVSLRSLGTPRTLVLIDGERLIPDGSSVDLNIIPLGMVERVDVLRDGASSIYGADAIGGVVNIITKKHADGMTFDSSYGASGHGDGKTYSLDATVGTNTDHSNVLIGVGWSHRDAIAGDSRAWANDPHIGDTYYEGGSAYRQQLDILQDEYSNNVWANGVEYVNKESQNPNTAAIAGLAPNLVYLPGKGVVKLNANGPDWQTLTGSLDRKQINFNSHFDITNNITFVAEGFFTDRTSEQKLRPEPLLGDTIATYTASGDVIFPGLIIPTNAPGNTTGGTITAYLTPTQFGPRTYDQDSKTFRIHVGFEGTLFGNYKWEAGYVDQENTEVLAIGNSGNWNHLAQITGQIACIDVPGGCTNSLPNVQPHWFDGPNNIFTPEQLAYLEYTRHDNQYSFERYAFADVNGPIWDLPAGTLRFAAGAEHREEYLTYTPDQLTSEGWTANASNPTAGGYNVTSGYAEFYIPVLKDMLVKSLDLSPSVRLDHYNTFGSAATWKVGLNLAVTDEVRLRGSISTGFRSPQVAELFGGASISDNSSDGDPCETNPALAAGNSNYALGVKTPGSQCAKVAAAAGSTVTTFTDPLDAVPASQLQTQVGGSPALKPEESHGVTAGIIITPKFLPGSSLTVDYWRTSISHAILTGGIAGNLGNDFILDGCYGVEQNQSFCNDIVRNANGVITQINSLNTNAGSQTVNGVDIELTYDTKAAGLALPFPGAIKVDVQASKLLQDWQLNVDGSTTSYVGYFDTDNENIYPTWRGVFNLDYRLSDWTFHWDTRYTQKMTNINGGPDVYGNKIPDMFYHAVSASYAFKPIGTLEHAKVTFGIDNLLDTDPPFIASDGNSKSNELAGPFDVVGRFFYGRLSLSF